MRVRRFIRRLIIFLVVAVPVAAAVVYVLASVKPAAYRPGHLSPEQQEAGMQLFVKHVVEFGNRVGATGPGEHFTWTLTAEQANRYLASLDAIASLRETSRRVHAIAQMERAGLVDPSVAMGDGVLTIMGRVRQYDKIVSVDVGFEFDEAGDVAVRIRQMRIGLMPIPQALLEERLDAVRAKLTERLARADTGGSARLGAIDMNRLAALMRQVVTMLDGRHVKPELTLKLGARHKTVIRKIEITEGKLTLHCYTPEGRS